MVPKVNLDIGFQLPLQVCASSYASQCTLGGLQENHQWPICQKSTLGEYSVAFSTVLNAALCAGTPAELGAESACRGEAETPTLSSTRTLWAKEPSSLVLCLTWWVGVPS